MGNNKLLTIVTQKTNTLVVIPMHPKVETIFRKYGNQPPAVQSNQSTNRILKKLCRKAGITNFVSVVETSGGIKHEITYEKCDMVTSHTARRSFGKADEARLSKLQTIQGLSEALLNPEGKNEQNQVVKKFLSSIEKTVRDAKEASKKKK